MRNVKYALLAAALLSLLPVLSASAHRLDEYLQAATITLARNQISVRLRLTPGADVAEGVIRQIDRNGDGNLSANEQQSYVSHIAQTLSVSLNGHPGHLVTEGSAFPSIAAMRAGTGVIDIQFSLKTNLVPGNYRLVYRNQGSGPETEWLVNCLLPQDADLHVLQQARSEDQSAYTLDFSVDPS